MDIRKLQRAIVDGLEDVKAQDIVVFNTEHLSPLFERVIIASGTSNRQTKALAASVRDAVKAIHLPVLSTEGGENGEWIIVDCGAAVAHIMQPNIREYYRLEEIWGGKPIKMKLNGAAKGLVKAESDDEDEDDEPPVKKAAAKKSPAKAAPAKAAPAKKAGAKKIPAAKAAAPAKKAAAAKQRSEKAAPAKRSASPSGKGGVAAKKTSSSRGAPAKPIQKIVVGKPAPAKKAAATRSAKAAGPAAKRPPARKTSSRA
jgi:ribosome-associated protein